MVRWLLVIHPEVRKWLHEIRKADRLTAALIGQAIQHVIDGRGPDEGRPLAEARYAEYLAALNDEDE